MTDIPTLILDACAGRDSGTHIFFLCLPPLSPSVPIFLSSRSLPRLPAASQLTIYPCRSNPLFPNPNSGVRRRLLVPVADTTHPVISLCLLGCVTATLFSAPQPATTAGLAAAPWPLLLSPPAIDGRKI